MQLKHRASIGVLASVLAATMLAACGAPGGNAPATSAGGGDVPATPSAPVTLNILDIAGDLQLTQSMIDQYAAQNPNIVASVNYTTGTAPDMPGKVKAQQDANNVQIDMILTGTDGLASGISQGLYLPIATAFADRLPNMANYLAPAAAMQTLAQGQGVVVTYYPSGPLLEYNPATVTNPPTTPAELLAWAQAHPGKFGYANPANSGPARTFLMGLPYLLGDSDPRDPVNGWTKTWDFLKQLDQYIDYYPAGTSATMTNIANGTWDMIATTTGWDINPRALGTVPANYQISAYQNFTWVTDAHYVVIPKGVSADKQSAIISLVNYMLQPEVNAMAFDSGYFYPGPAVQGATLSMAPQKDQDVINQFGRPEYDNLIANNPTALPLDSASMVKAYDLWNQNIGQNGSKVK